MVAVSTMPAVPSTLFLNSHDDGKLVARRYSPWNLVFSVVRAPLNRQARP